MIHMQRSCPGWLEAVAGDFPFAVKGVDAANLARDAHVVNPNIVGGLRHWYDKHQVFGGTWEANLQRARDFFATFIDQTFKEQYAPYIQVVEEWNEYIASSNNTLEIEERRIWAKAAAHVWKYEYRTQPEYSHIRLAICNTAIGNWIPTVFAEIAQEYDCLIGYHPYTYWSNKERWDGDWMNLSGLWDIMEDVWEIKVDWWFSECGPFEGAETGWRSKECLGGNVDLYVEAMRQWIADVRLTDAYKEGRIYGFTVYTVNTVEDPAFGSFHTDQPELGLLMDMVKHEWVKNDKPEVPIDPDLKVAVDHAVWHEHVDNGVRLNPNAAIQQAIHADGLNIPINEVPVVVDQYSGVAQSGQDLSTGSLYGYFWSAQTGIIKTGIVVPPGDG